MLYSRESIYKALTLPQKMLLLRTWEESPFALLKFECDNAIITRSIQNAQNDIFMSLDGGSVRGFLSLCGHPLVLGPFRTRRFDYGLSASAVVPENRARCTQLRVQDCKETRKIRSTDEQPGKIFHEMRRGEMARTREVPFVPYYGSVDSTPLSLILLNEYVRWSGDLERLREWWPNALRAVEWIDKWGDSDGDGFLEYAKQSPNGLVNQGWKDSHDSIMHADGALRSRLSVFARCKPMLFAREWGCQSSRN